LRNRIAKNASLFHLRPNKKFTLCLSMYGILMSNLKHTQSRTHDLYERLFVDAKYADKGLAGGENRPCRSQPRDEQMRGFDCYLLPQRQPLLFYLLGIYLCARLQNSIYAILHAAFQVKREPRAHFWPKSNWHSATDLLSCHLHTQLSTSAAFAGAICAESTSFGLT
jgi:hypothetical protein